MTQQQQQPTATEACKAVRSICEQAMQRGLFSDFATIVKLNSYLDVLAFAADYYDLRPATGQKQPVPIIPVDDEEEDPF